MSPKGFAKIVKGSFRTINLPITDHFEKESCQSAVGNIRIGGFPAWGVSGGKPPADIRDVGKTLASRGFLCFVTPRCRFACF